MTQQCVNNCCFCCTLETGGFVIGWINAIFGSIGFIGSIAIVILAIISLGQADLTDDQRTTLIISIVVFSIYIIFALIYTIAGILLIIGTKRREHRKIVMQLIIMGIGVILSFLNLIGVANAGTITSSIIGALIQLYFFICIYSLYAKIRNENNSIGTYMN